MAKSNGSDGAGALIVVAVVGVAALALADDFFGFNLREKTERINASVASYYQTAKANYGQLPRPTSFDQILDMRPGTRFLYPDGEEGVRPVISPQREAELRAMVARGEILRVR